MTREEIGNEIGNIILESLIHEMWCEPAPEEYGDVYHTGYAHESMNKTISNILQFLHSRDVVIRKEEHRIYTGYYQIEPLIEESK